MRLTLRTLMAYRDGVLSTRDTSDLHKRIKQSEVAGNLLRRIESVVQQPQISAPNVDATGLAGDPNTVAEYLDDALLGEHVPEFERICIVESEMQLAELAHCHQLLADAMHSQVRVPQPLKSMILGLANAENRAQLEQRLLQNADTAKAIVVAEPKVAARRDSGTQDKIATHKTATQARDEKRQDSAAVDQDRRRDPAHNSPTNAAAVEVAAERPQVQAPMVTSGGGSIKPKGLDLEVTHLAHEIPEYLVGSGRDGWRVPLAIGAMITLLALLGWLALGPIGTVRQLFDSRNSLAHQSTLDASERKTLRDTDTSAVTVGTVADSTKAIASAKDTVPKAVESSENSPPAPVIEERAPVVEEPPAPDVSATRPDTPLASVAGSETPPVTSAPPVVRQESIVWSPSGAAEQHAVLFLRRVTPAGQFSLIRLAPLLAVAEDAEIVAPPAMRTTLDLAGGCQWTVCGPTQMLAPKSVDGNSAQLVVRTPLCRALVKPGSHGNTLSIGTPAGGVSVKFSDASSMAAVEVAYRPVASGLITDARAYKPLLVVVAVAGQVLLEYTDKSQTKTQSLNLGDGLAMIDGAPRLFKLGEIPDWYRGNSERPLDEHAALDLNKLLPVGAEIGEGLISLSEHRRPETAALAVQSSMLLGDWNPFAHGFLANPAMHNHWAGTIKLAEQLIASEPGSAKALQQAFEGADPARGKGLFSLLEGIPEDQQPSDFIPKLIELLDSSQLDERVLATHHLRRLTGKDFGYQPHLPNRTSVQQWRREFAANRLKINNVGDPLWESKR